jgi:hypothetical protein
MAKEITIQLDFKRQHATVASDNHFYPSRQKRIDQAGVGQSDTKQTIGTTEETISFTDIATNGFVFFENLDATNYVEWGTATGDYTGKMLAGEPAGPFRLNAGKTLYMKANTAACRVRIIHYEA